MSRFLRAALVGLVSLIALTFAVATASATGTGPVRINTAATTATGVDTTLSVLTASGTRTAICRRFVLGASITSDGTVSLPAAGITLSTCTFSGVTVSITASQAWTGRIRHLDNAAGNVSAVTLDIANVLARFSGAGCTFDVVGTALGSNTLAAPVAHGTLVNVGSITFPSPLATAPLSLRVTNVAGTCSLLGIANGNLSSFSGVFAFSPVVNGAGI